MKKLNDPLSWISEEIPQSIVIKEIEIDKIIVKDQVRTKNNVTENIEELAESIKEFGINQNLLVTETQEGYILIAGERRLEAAKRAGLTTVPCSLKFISESDIWKYQLIENIHRKDLDPIELANLYKRLKDDGMSIRDIAGEIKRSKSHVQEILKLLELPDEIKEKVSAQRTVKKAVEIGKVKDKDTQDKLIKNYDNMTAEGIKEIRQKNEKPTKSKEQQEAIIERTEKPKNKKPEEEHISYYKTLVDYQEDVITYDQAEEALLGLGMRMDQVKKHLKTSDEIKASKKKFSITEKAKEEIIEAYKLGAYTYEEAEKILADECNGGIEAAKILLAPYAEKEIGKEQEQKNIKTGEEPNTETQKAKDEADKVNQIVSLQVKIYQFNKLHSNIIVELGKPKDIKTHNLPPMQTGEAAVIKIAFKSHNLVNDLINILNKAFPVK